MIQQWRLRQFTRRLFSGTHSSIVCQWDTTLAPGLSSSSSLGLKRRFTSGERKSMTTVASPRSALNRSFSRKAILPAWPSFKALSLLCLIRRGSRSVPTPRQPVFFAALITTRPSPQPRSYTTSCPVTSAILIISSTTRSGEASKGTSSFAVTNFASCMSVPAPGLPCPPNRFAARGFERPFEGVPLDPGPEEKALGALRAFLVQGEAQVGPVEPPVADGGRAAGS